MSARSFIACVASLMASLFAASDSNAYVCIGPDQSALPLPSASAPVNSHVWLFLPKHHAMLRCQRPGGVPCEGRYELRAAAGTPAVAVPVASVREVAGGDYIAVEVIPAGALPARATVEAWWVPHAWGAPRMLGIVHTGDARDVTVPTAPSVTRAVLRVERSLVPSEPVSRSIAFEGKPALDDGAPVPLYAVWIADRSGAFTDAPSAIIDVAIIDRSMLFGSTFLSIGTGSNCGMTVNVPNATGAQLRIRGIDLAGNMGPAVELLLGR